MRRALQTGISLVEVMVVVFIVGLLIAFGIPSFNTWVQNSQIRTAGEGLMNGLQTAKNEAIRRNSCMQMAMTGKSGWQVNPCSDPDANAGGTASGLHVTYGNLLPGQPVQLSAHVRYEMGYFQYGNSAEIGYDGSLRLTGGSNTTLTYASPGFQTLVPEPDASIAAAAAIASLVSLARRLPASSRDRVS